MIFYDGGTWTWGGKLEKKISTSQVQSITYMSKNNCLNRKSSTSPCKIVKEQFFLLQILKEKLCVRNRDSHFAENVFHL